MTPAQLTPAIRTPPAERPTAVLTRTEVLGHQHRPAAGPPPEVAVCFWCWAMDSRPDPVGWVMAKGPADRRLMCRHGVCPACLATDARCPTTA